MKILGTHWIRWIVTRAGLSSLKLVIWVSLYPLVGGWLVTRVGMSSLKLVTYFFNWYSGGWSPIGSTRYCGHQWPTVPALGDHDDGETGGMIGRGNWSNRRKPGPVPLCPPQTPHAARMQTRAATVGSQQLTTWAMAWPRWWPYWVTVTYKLQSANFVLN
jgi:hypothetical protein